jgi:hypothetical protein
MAKHNSKPTIEVCHGPDCFGSGGGAALLELEELVIESGSSFLVVQGGCRNFCSMGPNVHVDSRHFTGVKSVEDCQQVAKKVGLQLEYETDCKQQPIVSMLMKRVDRLRWNALRDMARFNVKRKRGGNSKTKTQEELREGLQEAFQAEVGAALKSDHVVEGKERAQRRLLRFEEMLPVATIANVDSCESSSDDDRSLCDFVKPPF